MTPLELAEADHREAIAVAVDAMAVVRATYQRIVEARTRAALAAVTIRWLVYKNDNPTA
jgi:hypothetical protein